MDNKVERLLDQLGIDVFPYQRKILEKMASKSLTIIMPPRSGKTLIKDILEKEYNRDKNLKGT